ncbi:MAG: PsbP-related protein [Cyanobacteriota bacterium]|nr:PsbP-related protein [Cyanobacteriota bacterium]
MKNHLLKLIFGLTTGVVLSSCSSTNSMESNNWKVYSNERYGYQFPYPSNWFEVRASSNADGQTFRHPQNPAVEMRAWAGYDLSNSIDIEETQGTVARNFTTEKGLPGELKVNIGQETSSMTLTFIEGQVQYHWQAEAPSQEFDDYYKFFYYVASQYDVEASRDGKAR